MKNKNANKRTIPKSKPKPRTKKTVVVKEEIIEPIKKKYPTKHAAPKPRARAVKKKPITVEGLPYEFEHESIGLGLKEKEELKRRIKERKEDLDITPKEEVVHMKERVKKGKSNYARINAYIMKQYNVNTILIRTTYSPRHSLSNNLPNGHI